MFYTSVSQLGKKIYHRYIDSYGQRQQEVVYNFPIELFVRSNKGEHVGLMGEQLASVEFSSIGDAREFLENYEYGQEIYGQTDFVKQFISYQYPTDIKFDFSKIITLIIDIEVAYDHTGFPAPERADQPILSIACKVLNSKDGFIVFGTKDSKRTEMFRYVHCQSEEDLIKKFQAYWKSTDFDILTGWNCATFDVPYIINRTKRLLGEQAVNNYSPFSKKSSYCVREKQVGFKKGVQKGTTFDILGISVLDYLDLYRKYAYSTLESLRLDVVANHELGVGKVDYSEYGGLMGLYEKNYNLFLEYNMIDVSLIEKLENKLNYIFLALTIAYIGKTKYTDSFTTVPWWDSYIYNELKAKNIQIPPKPKHDDNEEQIPIVGAYVKDPIPNKYEWIVTLDLTSLYPSIIMSFNLSPETLVSIARYNLGHINQFIDMKMELSEEKKSDVCVLANGSTYRKDSLGIMPQLVKTMFSQRKTFKGLMTEASKELEELKNNKATEEEITKKQGEVATLNAKQQAFKISLNSLYGAMANKFFRYNSRDISEGITMTGQLIIQYISKQINIKLNELFKTDDVDYVIFNDTDSAGLNLSYLVNKVFPIEEERKDKQRIINFLDTFSKKQLLPYIADKFQELATYLNAYENRLSMNREVIADCGIWRGKKHYILQMWDKEGVRYKQPKLKMMGIETAKSSTPKIVRGSLEKAIKILLNGTEKEIHAYVKEFEKEFFAAPIEDISFPRGVSDIDKTKKDYYDKKAIASLKEGYNKELLLPNLIGGRTPIHVKGVILYNELIDLKKVECFPKIKNGDKIKFVYLLPNNPTKCNVISFLDTLPSEFGLDQFIDRKTQFNKTFLDPLKSLTDIVKWTTEKRTSLAQFFVED